MLPFDAVGHAALKAFGRDCLWTPVGGAATPVRLILVEGTRIDTLNDPAGHVLQFATASGAARDIGIIKRGDLVTEVDTGATWKVGTPSPDGRGMIRFDLREAT